MRTENLSCVKGFKKLMTISEKRLTETNNSSKGPCESICGGIPAPGLYSLIVH